jgi:hypothetical protein
MMFNNNGITATLVVGSGIGLGAGALAVNGLIAFYDNYEINNTLEKALNYLNLDKDNIDYCLNNVNVILPVALIALTAAVTAIFYTALGLSAALLAAGLITLPLAVYGAYSLIDDMAQDPEKKAAKEKSVAEKKAAADKIAADKKAAADKIAADKKAAADKITADKKAAVKKAEEERLAAEKKAAEKKAANQKAEEERVAASKKRIERETLWTALILDKAARETDYSKAKNDKITAFGLLPVPGTALYDIKHKSFEKLVEQEKEAWKKLEEASKKLKEFGEV